MEISKSFYNNLLKNINLAIKTAINEHYSENTLFNNKLLKAERITNNTLLKTIIDNSDFEFMLSQIIKGENYLINGTYDLTWWKFILNDEIIGLLGICPMENMQHEYIKDADEIIYIACVEISKNIKNKLGITDQINKFKSNKITYKTILMNIIEFIEDYYGDDYYKIRLSTESDAEKLKNVYELCGFKVIGRTLWDGFEMEKEI